MRKKPEATWSSLHFLWACSGLLIKTWGGGGGTALLLRNSDAEVMYFLSTCVCLELMQPSRATNVAGLWAIWEGHLLLAPGPKC